MATSSLLKSARSALKPVDLASRCLSATGTTAWTAIPLGQSCRLFSTTLYSVSPEQAKLEEALKVTDDIINSEAKLRALFKKWLSLSKVHHFDMEDRKAFEERFAIFKGKARHVNQHYKKVSNYTLMLNKFADLTREEFAGKIKYKVYPKKEVPESYLDVQES
ncbi:hypothetical protein MKW92_044772 [Papaver armeniacum]|nr:hypothetical protein MKW92_044772 [Papaver armeniacum]